MNDWKGERLPVEQYNSVTAEHLHRYAMAVEIVKNKRVLDIASGEGYGSNILSSVASNVTGVDISDDAINHAKKKYDNKPNLSFIKGSLQNIPLPDNSIDVVVSFESIEHDTEHDIIMTELKRVLKADGILIMSTPDKYQYRDLPGYKNPFHVKELYQDEFKALISKYFSCTVFFSQRYYAGSLIVPMSDSDKSFKMFTGDYSSVMAYDAITEPMFIVTIASDFAIDYFTTSFFNLTEKIEGNYNKNYNRLLHSKSYKLGNFFISKLAFLRDKLLK